jgi:hypothetical protein
VVPLAAFRSPILTAEPTAPVATEAIPTASTLAQIKIHTGRLPGRSRLSICLI